MEILSQSIAENLKRIRSARGLTLDEVAELTDISKSMLGQIERNTANPTVSTIWKICNGLKIPYTALMTPTKVSEGVIDANDADIILSDDGLYESIPFFPFDITRNFEIFKVSLKENGILESEPHTKGTEEYIILIDGNLAVEHGGKTDILRKNQALRFSGDVPHKYYNLGKTEVVLVTVVSYPQFQ